MRMALKRPPVDRRGNFGLILALLMAPLALAMGVALDIGYALTVKTEIQGAADSAAVGARANSSLPNATRTSFSGPTCRPGR